MIYQFDTDSREHATAALIVYATYRSRDKRFKVSLDMWGRIERFCKSSSKRSKTIPLFIEKFKLKMKADSIHPRWTETGLKTDVLVSDNKGGFLQPSAEDQREFLTNIMRDIDQSEVLNSLYTETAWVVLLVRERLEREKLTAKMEQKINEQA